MRQTVLTFGLISAALSSATMLATFPLIDSVGIGKTDVIGYTTIVLSAPLVFFGIRSFRDRVGHGRVAFGRGGWAKKYAACMVERVRASGAGQEKIDETAKQAEALKRLWDNPLTNAALAFAEPLPIGLVAVAIAAAILRRR